MQDLLDTLKQCVERLDRYRWSSQRVRESNTKAGPIERSSASRSCGPASSSTARCTPPWMSCSTPESHPATWSPWPPSARAL
jgi:hypothetical protein